MQRTTSSSIARVVLIASLGLMVVGCGMEQIEPPMIKADSGVPAADTGSTQGLQKPLVDPLPSSACGDSVPIQGTAPAGASVFIVGGGTSGLATDAHATTGRFCLDAPLKKNAVNNFEIRAQDPDKGMSEPVKVSITHGNCSDDAPKTTPEQPKSKNVALSATGTSSQTAAEGNEGFLTDGKTSTFAKYSGGYAGFEFGGWVTVKLDKLYMLEKIVINWKDSSGSGGDYGSQYSLLYSSMSDPGNPDLKNGYWTVVDVASGDGGTDAFDLKSTKPLARHVAIWMKHDGNSFSWSESFSIAEIEAWDAPTSSSPIPTGKTTNTCAALGSN